MSENCNQFSVAAGIVLFNPDNIGRVKKCIDSIYKQVDKVYIYDNSTINIKIELPDDIIYRRANRNRGIGFALNQIMEMAQSDGIRWVITMDQDSIMPIGIVKDFKQFFGDENIGIICPQVIDKRRAYMKAAIGASEEYIDMCITSASCTSVEAWKKIDQYDNWLFVDLVDNDFCKRLTISGYKILRLNKWILDQEFGEIAPKTKRKQEFWIKISEILHNKNFAKFSYKKNVSALRVYYTCRNIIYLNRKFTQYNGIGYHENYNCNSFLGFIISFVLPSILRADNKIKVIKAVKNGFYDGYKTQVKPWDVKPR